jgi:hypothetical protein
MNPIILTLFSLPVIVWLTLAITAGWIITMHRRRLIAGAGTVPANFPPDPLMPIGAIQVGNKLGNTAAFATTTFFTAPISGWYALGWGVHIDVTDGAGTITLTVTPPSSVAIPGVQAAPATPSDGKGPLAPYYMAAGSVVTAAAAVSGLTGTTFDVYVFAERLF